jgi:voltage-gated potassium channel Kch
MIPNQPDPSKATYEELLHVRRNFRILAALALGVLAGGAVFYHMVENFAWLDSFYFCTITLATVGYGDIVPTTNAGKLFTIFYVLIGIGIIATFASQLLRNAVVRRELRRMRAQR